MTKVSFCCLQLQPLFFGFWVVVSKLCPLVFLSDLLIVVYFFGFDVVVFAAVGALHSKRNSHIDVLPKDSEDVLFNDYFLTVRYTAVRDFEELGGQVSHALIRIRQKLVQRETGERKGRPYLLSAANLPNFCWQSLITCEK